MGVDALMYVVPATPLTEDEVRTIGWQLGQSFYSDTFLSNADGKWGVDPHGPVSSVHHSADAEYDEWYGAPEGALWLHLMGRYYGPGYERGPLWTYLSIAGWFRVALPMCQVYYGGDSGEQIELLTPQLTLKLWVHFVKHGHWPYIGAFDQSGGMCEFCRQPFSVHTWFGASGDRGGSCPGCGLTYRWYASDRKWRRVPAEEIK